MKLNLKKTITTATIILTMGAISAPALAASTFANPAEIVSNLTGKSLESVIAEKTEQGKSYGEIAAEAGVLDKFKTESLKMKKDILAKKVAAGTITQAQADTTIATIENNQSMCEGTGSIRTGQGIKARFGPGMRQGDNTRKSDDSGRSHGQLNGKDFDGLMNGHGSCYPN